MSETKLEEMVNIGPTIAGKLRNIGIETPDELRRRGSVKTYRQLQSATSNRLPICYHLLSLEGAIRKTDWRDLPETVRDRLLKEANPKP